jgi:uncharacterized RDD family membrane protein YckC
MMLRVPIPSWASAAQNGPVLVACQKCGAVNEHHAAACSFCESPIASASHRADDPLEPVAVSAVPRPVAVPSSQPEWRREVAHRLEAYRSRRRRLLPDDSQSALPFSAALSAEPAAEDALEHSGSSPAPRAVSRPRRPERVEIAVLQPEFDFSTAEDAHLHPQQAQSGLIPVADLSERFRAGMLDTAFLLLAYLAFLVLFGSLGGQFSFGRADTVVYLVTFALFYAQYFALFTVFGGATPGMRLRGLEVISFDGSAPGPAQLLWRSFGYLVSAGTLLLGFLWALWDDDHLTWQDRISQTYIARTAAIAGVYGEGHPTTEDPARHLSSGTLSQH